MENLIRSIVYTERKDIDEFLEESPLWDQIYEVFLETRRETDYIDIPTLKIFNEAKYQCVRIFHDKHPEDGLKPKYMNEAVDNLELLDQAAYLCFCIVYVILALYKNPPKKFQRVCKILEKVFLEQGIYYFSNFYEFVSNKRKANISYNIDLSYDPMSPRDIEDASHTTIVYCDGKPIEFHSFDYIEGWWEKVTNNFAPEAIREFVNIWEKKDDQLEIIKIIEKAYSQLVQSEIDTKTGNSIPSKTFQISKEFFKVLWAEIANKEDEPVLLLPKENPEMERMKRELGKTKQLLEEARKRDIELIEEGERMLEEASEREKKLRAELDRQSVEAKNREREINNQWKKDLKELQKQMSGDNITQVFCHIATSYMKRNEKKSQGKREAIKTCLLEIASQLRIQLPDDVNEAISNFDDENPQTTVVYKIGNYNPTIYKDQAQSNDVHIKGEIQLPESEAKKLIEQKRNGNH